MALEKKNKLCHEKREKNPWEKNDPVDGSRGYILFLVRPKSSFNHQYLGASPPLIASITRNGSIRAGACLIIGHTQESKTHKSGTQWIFFNPEHGELWWMGLDGFGWVWMDLDGFGWVWMGLDGFGVYQYNFRCSSNSSNPKFALQNRVLLLFLQLLQVVIHLWQSQTVVFRSTLQEYRCHLKAINMINLCMLFNRIDK